MRPPLIVVYDRRTMSTNETAPIPDYGSKMRLKIRARERSPSRFDLTHPGGLTPFAAVLVVGLLLLGIVPRVYGQHPAGLTATTHSAISDRASVLLVRPVNNPVDLALGKVGGRQFYQIHAVNDTVAVANFVTIWPENTLYIFPIDEQVVHVRAGGDPGDEVIAGAGARTIGIACVDVEGVPVGIQNILIPGGIGFVLALKGALASNDSLGKCRHINDVIVLDTGTQQGSNLGRIEIANAADVLLATIEIGAGKSQHSMRIVPVTEDWVLFSAIDEAEAAQKANLKTRFIRDCLRTAAPFSAALTIDSHAGLEGSVPIQFAAGGAFPGGSCFWVEGQGGAGMTAIRVRLGIERVTKEI